jgi:CRISPR-associated protein Cas1
MIKRIVDISEKAFLRLENNQLVIEKEGKTVGSVPVEDLGALILQNSAIVITQAILVSCQKHNVVVIFCDEKHLPYSLLLPITDAHTLHSKVLKNQVAATKPMKKRLWQQIVKQKILNQLETLDKAGTPLAAMARLSKAVKSGDPANVEGQAAKLYWRALFGNTFRRNSEAEGINAILNYGYAVIRALVARAVVSSGLHPSLGLHHSNQYNGLALADDLMEPFRPWVDWEVYLMTKSDIRISVNKATKQILLGLMSKKV